MRTLACSSVYFPDAEPTTRAQVGAMAWAGCCWPTRPRRGRTTRSAQPGGAERARADKPDQQRDFFVSYTQADRAWAEWIAWELEAAGHTTVLQAWDMPAGTAFVHAMDQAVQHTRHVVLILYQQGGMDGCHGCSAPARSGIISEDAEAGRVVR
jgi:hypothetical protein